MALHICLFEYLSIREYFHNGKYCETEIFRNYHLSPLVERKHMRILKYLNTQIGSMNATAIFFAKFREMSRNYLLTSWFFVDDAVGKWKVLNLCWTAWNYLYIVVFYLKYPQLEVVLSVLVHINTFSCKNPNSNPDPNLSCCCRNEKLTFWIFFVTIT